VAEVDTLRRFVFERYPFRGQLVHLGPAWKAMMEHHDYPDEVRDTLGEAVAAAALLASTLKFKGLLTLSAADHADGLDAFDAEGFNEGFRHGESVVLLKWWAKLSLPKTAWCRSFPTVGKEISAHPGVTFEC
jgi:hypothetical protein